MDLTASQWGLLSALVSPVSTQPTRGRPPQEARAVLNGVFWVLRTGARWADLPRRYPPHQTCHRRFRDWLTSGVLARCFVALADDLARRSRLPGADGATSTRRPPISHRSWQWHTALLLQCPLARQALGSTAEVPGLPEGPEPSRSANRSSLH